MKILAIEFSSDQRSVALVENGRVLGSAMETATRNTHALTLVTQALTEAGSEREAVECIAIGIGPGSYTGIRSAIALAQGWQLASGEIVKLLGISSVECLAAEAQAQGLSGRVNVAIDAQRGELYFAGYDLTSTSCREIQALKLAAIEEVRSRHNAGEIMIGPEVTQWFAVGHVLFPTAAMLGRLGVGRADFVSGEKLEPIYLRATDFVKAPLPRVLPSGGAS